MIRQFTNNNNNIHTCAEVLTVIKRVERARSIIIVQHKYMLMLMCNYKSRINIMRCLGNSIVRRKIGQWHPTQWHYNSVYQCHVTLFYCNHWVHTLALTLVNPIQFRCELMVTISDHSVQRSYIIHYYLNCCWQVPRQL